MLILALMGVLPKAEDNKQRHANRMVKLTSNKKWQKFILQRSLTQKQKLTIP